MLAIEPMTCAGRHQVRMGEDGWAIYSQDGSATAHFEFTVAITADGPRILTPWHESVLVRRGGGLNTAATLDRRARCGKPAVRDETSERVSSGGRTGSQSHVAPYRPRKDP